MHYDNIFLNQSESFFPPSPKVLQAISNALSEVNRYPQTQSENLRHKLAEYTKTSPSQIIVGNGSDDIIELIIRVLVNSDEQVLIPVPSFPWYWYASKNLNKNHVFIYSDREYNFNINSILENVSSSVKLIFIANPNNPTGKIIQRQELIKLIENSNCFVVIDECYYEFCQETIIDLVKTYSNLIIIRSFSKGFALAGLRIGYAVMNDELAYSLRIKMQLFGVNSIAQVAAIAALSDLDYYQMQINSLLNQKEFLKNELLKMNFDVCQSYTNFLFVGTKKLGILAKDLVEELKQKNLYVKDCSMLPGVDKYHFRTSVGNCFENEMILTQLNIATQFK